MTLLVLVALATIICMTIVSHYVWPASRSREVATNIVRSRSARSMTRREFVFHPDDVTIVRDDTGRIVAYIAFAGYPSGEKQVTR